MKKLLLFVLMCGMIPGFNSAPAAKASDWSYSGENGPQRWAGLTPDFSACSGKNQSPINLTSFIEADLKPIKISYQSQGHEIMNNGHTVQVNYNAGSSILIDGVQYDLMQFHFHAPSENLINGRSFAMETHFVHRDRDGNLAVIALLFDEGKENKALADIWHLMPNRKGEKRKLPSPFNAALLLPENPDYYLFNGSLTTPPCTEGVRWLVFKKSVQASKEQVEAFAHAIHHPNNRPVQPINARPVLE